MTDQRKYVSKLAGKHVLIIGGSAGIGYGVAEASLEHGAAVTISSSNATRLAAAVAALSAAYPTAASEGRVAPGVVCDLGAADDDALDANVANLFATITARPSPTGDGKTTTTTIDHIVYSAGDALATIPLADASTPRVRRAGTTLPSGTLSSFTLTSGTAAHRPLPGWAVVGGFATGLLGMTRSLALDLAPARIRVNCVAPGAVDTGLWDGMVGAGGEGEKRKVFEALEARLPTGRVGRVEDVAEAFLYLMRDANATGSVVTTDGGALLV
ncbi:hypothetical protein SLS58_003209 [Diplodia intermedia]|uniref:Short chain dehydrogenase n=1 Tax=Diplodia intermedia TaxID=856260 RepID=A0ABR3TX60_9PEZI